MDRCEGEETSGGETIMCLFILTKVIRFKSEVASPEMFSSPFRKDGPMFPLPKEIR